MRTLIVFAVLAVSGCAGGAVGWGGTHEVLASDAAYMSVVYDPMVGGFGPAAAEAARHCARTNRSAIPNGNHAEGAVRVQHFLCQ